MIEPISLVLDRSKGRDPGPCWADIPVRAKDDRPRSDQPFVYTVRFLYHVLVGNLNPDLNLHKACKNPRCMNPFHHQQTRKFNRQKAQAKKSARVRDLNFAMSPMGMIEGAIEHLDEQSLMVNADSIIAHLQTLGIHVTEDQVKEYMKDYAHD